MTESVTLRDLRRIVARARIDLPKEASELLERRATPEAIFTQAFAANKFAEVVRGHYLQREPELEHLIEPLPRLGETEVWLVQADHGDEIASFMIDGPTKALLAADYVDRAASRNDLTVEELRQLLERDPSRMTTAALTALARIPDDEVLRVSKQGAVTTARMLWTKYNLARERGIEVLGLEEFVEALVALGPATIGLCPAMLARGAVTIALDARQDRVLGIIVATHTSTHSRQAQERGSTTS